MTKKEGLKKLEQLIADYDKRINEILKKTKEARKDQN